MHQICQMHMVCCCCCSYFLKPWLISVQDMWCVLFLLLLPPSLCCFLNVSIFRMGRSPAALFNEFWRHFVLFCFQEIFFSDVLHYKCVWVYVCIWMPADDYIDWWRICYGLWAVKTSSVFGPLYLSQFLTFVHTFLTFVLFIALSFERSH